MFEADVTEDNNLIFNDNDVTCGECNKVDLTLALSSNGICNECINKKCYRI